MMSHEEFDAKMVAEEKWSMVSYETLLNMAEEGKLSTEAGKELAKRSRQLVYPRTNKNNKQVEFVGRLLEDFVNNTICPKKELAEYMVSGHVHRTNQQSFFGLMMAILKAYAELPDSSQDARNKYACQSAKQLMNLIEKNELPISFPCI